MEQKIKITFTTLLLLFFFNSKAQVSMDNFPSFELESGNGKKIQSETLIHSSKKTLLLLYGSYGTPCNKSVTILNDLKGKWEAEYDLDIKVIALDNDRSQKWLKENGVSTNSYFDTSGFLLKKAGIKSCPQVFLYNPKKELIYSRVGFIHEEEGRDELVNELKYQKLLKTTKAGVIELNYSNGSIHFYRTVKDMKLNGLSKQYSRSGTLTLIGNYIDGKKTGEWKTYFDNGELYYIANFSNDTVTGEWKMYYKNGKLNQIGKEENGITIGKYEIYYENGNVKQTGNFTNGKANGEWKIYHENGKLDQFGNLSNGLQNGEWKFYNQNGQLTQVGKYANGKEIGEWKTYHDNGQLKEIGKYENGKKTGEWKTYYKNGNVYQITLRNEDKLVDVLTCKDSKGNKLEKGSLINGNGTVNNYDEDGKLKDTFNYKNGDKQ